VNIPSARGPVKGLNLHFDDLRMIADREAGFRQARRGVKAYCRVPGPLRYGTIRMCQALTETRGVQVHASCDFSEPAGVLGVDAWRSGA
jgi:hypothetical protein